MIRFYFHPTPNPAKVALMLEEAGLVYQVVPVDTSRGEQHAAAFRAVIPSTNRRSTSTRRLSFSVAVRAASR